MRRLILKERGIGGVDFLLKGCTQNQKQKTRVKPIVFRDIDIKLCQFFKNDRGKLKNSFFKRVQNLPLAVFKMLVIIILMVSQHVTFWTVIHTTVLLEIKNVAKMFFKKI